MSAPVKTTAEGFDYNHRYRKSLAACVCCYLFILEDRLLRADNIRVADQPALQPWIANSPVLLASGIAPATHKRKQIAFQWDCVRNRIYGPDNRHFFCVKVVWEVTSSRNAHPSRLDNLVTGIQVPPAMSDSSPLRRRVPHSVRTQIDSDIPCRPAPKPYPPEPPHNRASCRASRWDSVGGCHPLLSRCG